jgi:hypothetical protein
LSTPDYEISQLASLSAPASGDLLAAVDVSDTTTAPAGPGGSNKQLPLSGLLSWLQSNLASFASVIGFTAGTDTSGTAVASTPSLTSGTAAQLSTTQDVKLYCNIKTTSTFSLAIGPTSSPATTVVASASFTAPQLVGGIRIPKGWYVKATFTSADVVFTQVSC